MRDEDDTQCPRPKEIIEERIKLSLARDVDMIGRLVEEEDIGVAEEGIRDEDALALTARELADGTRDECRHADLSEHPHYRRLCDAWMVESEELGYGYGEGPIEGEGLRHVSDTLRVAHDGALRGGIDPHHRAQECRLARAIESDDGDDLAGEYLERNIVKHDLSAEGDGHVGYLNNRSLCDILFLH